MRIIPSSIDDGPAFMEANDCHEPDTGRFCSKGGGRLRKVSDSVRGRLRQGALFARQRDEREKASARRRLERLERRPPGRWPGGTDRVGIAAQRRRLERLGEAEEFPEGFTPLEESNDCHEPAGSPAGGQFCSKAGGPTVIRVVRRVNAGQGGVRSVISYRAHDEATNTYGPYRKDEEKAAEDVAKMVKAAAKKAEAPASATVKVPSALAGMPEEESNRYWHRAVEALQNHEEEFAHYEDREYAHGLAATRAWQNASFYAEQWGLQEEPFREMLQKVAFGNSDPASTFDGYSTRPSSAFYKAATEPIAKALEAAGVKATVQRVVDGTYRVMLDRSLAVEIKGDKIRIGQGGIYPRIRASSVRWNGKDLPLADIIRLAKRKLATGLEAGE